MAKLGKELRIHLDEGVHAFILASAKARGITPARLITEAVLAQADLLPRMEEAVRALETARAESDRIGIVADFIADRYRTEAMADDEEF